VVEQIVAYHPDLMTPGFMPMEAGRHVSDGTDVVISLLAA
jgi:hypothetical protein